MVDCMKIHFIFNPQINLILISMESFTKQYFYLNLLNEPKHHYRIGS